MISWTSVVPYALHEIASLKRPTYRFGSHSEFWRRRHLCPRRRATSDAHANCKNDAPFFDKDRPISSARPSRAPSWSASSTSAWKPSTRRGGHARHRGGGRRRHQRPHHRPGRVEAAHRLGQAAGHPGGHGLASDQARPQSAGRRTKPALAGHGQAALLIAEEEGHFLQRHAWLAEQLLGAPPLG